MVLTKLINKFWKTQEDSQITEFVKKASGIELTPDENCQGFTLREGRTYILNVEKPGNYFIAIEADGRSRSKVARLEKISYIIRPSMEFSGLDLTGSIVYEFKYNIAPLNTKQGHSLALETLAENPSRAVIPGLLEQATAVKKKRDKMKDDKRNYSQELFEDREKPKKGKWYRPIVIGAATAATLIGAMGYYDSQTEKNKDKAWQIEHDTKNLMFENDLARKQELEKARDTEIAAKRRQEEEIKKKHAEEDRIRTEKWQREHTEKWKAMQTELKNDLQAILQRTYNADITDLVKEAYCSDPFMKKNGPNWNETTFTVKFKQPEYVLRAYFRTDWQHGGKMLTRITTSFAIEKEDGKTIRFDEKGRIGHPENPSEADKKYVSDFVQKHDIEKVRKDVIDAVIKEKGHHQTDVYHGR